MHGMVLHEINDSLVGLSPHEYVPAITANGVLASDRL